VARIDGRLVVTAVVKDDAATLGRVSRAIARLRDRFGGIAFAVYENNSTDGTKALLGQLSGELRPFTLVSEDLSPEDEARIATARHRSGRPCRIELLARAREKAREIVACDYADYDYVLVIDMDAALVDLRGIVRNASRLAEGAADCVCANGVNKRLRYRDAFAYRSRRHPFGPELLGEYWWDETVDRIQGRLRGRKLLPVYSAFGGAALMTMAAFKAGTYSAIPGAEYMETQASLDLSEAEPEEASRAGREPIPNTNYSLPIVCEHVPFFYSMRKRGFDRVFIDPAWRILFLD
jgi:hypothetical protein